MGVEPSSAPPPTEAPVAVEGGGKGVEKWPQGTPSSIQTKVLS